MNIETIVVRDPDGDTETYLFVDGRPVEPTEYGIDPSRGWVWDEWCEHRDEMLAAASPAVRERLLEILADPPGGREIKDRDDRPWI